MNESYITVGFQFKSETQIMSVANFSSYQIYIATDNKTWL